MKTAKKVVLLAASVILVGAVCHVGLAEELEPNRMFGFSLPTFGSVKYNEAGEIFRVNGFNIGLGYSTRIFTQEGGLQPNRFNSYWGWGTIALLLPYVEFGFSYPIELADGEQFFVIDLGLLYIIPYINLSIWY